MGLSRPTRFERITRLGPAIACVTAVFTLTVCIILVKAQGHNTGGIVWPYLSDIGREAPEYYVMAVGLCTAGMGLFATTLHLFRLMQGLTHLRGASRAHMKRSLWVSLFSGTLSSAALCIGGAFTESAYPTLHFATDVIFFLLGLTYCTVVTVMFNILWRSRADDPSALLLPRLRLSLRGKLVSCAAAWAFFVIYMPICYPIVAGTITRDPQTGALNYRENLEVNTVRAVAQFFCVVSMLIFFGTITTDFRYQKAFFGVTSETQPITATVRGAGSGSSSGSSIGSSSSTGGAAIASMSKV